MDIFIGCAGWNIRKEHSELFDGSGSHLVRYAGRLGCVEINSSFYRSHRRSTYERWASSTPASFRFAVKLLKEITHVRRLENAGDLIGRFVDEVAGLGDKLGPILVQLPPSLAFDARLCESFFGLLRSHTAAAVVCEPRHRSWFVPEVDGRLNELRVGRVAADPAVVPAAAHPGGCPDVAYYRWHGSPEMYYSDYPVGVLKDLAERLATRSRVAKPRAEPGGAESAWCIFDNTAAGAAQVNALALESMVARSR